jgi:hypothetical protein
VLLLLVILPFGIIDRDPQVSVDPLTPAAATYVSGHASLAGAGGFGDHAGQTMLAVYAHAESTGDPGE